MIKFVLSLQKLNGLFQFATLMLVKFLGYSPFFVVGSRIAPGIIDFRIDSKKVVDSLHNFKENATEFGNIIML